MKNTHTIAGKDFETEQQARAYLKKLLNGHAHEVEIQPGNLEFVNELLKYHPQYHCMEASGIDLIIVTAKKKLDGTYYGPKYFKIIRRDGKRALTATGYECIENCFKTYQLI
jgi:hypothetical protein